MDSGLIFLKVIILWYMEC